MGRFEPSADPRDAVERGFYVPRPGRSIAEQLAARFELKPSASHLVVGGVGSGKTTQLIVACDKLSAAGDVCAVYVDVSCHRDPAWIDDADLLAVVGLELAKRLQASERTREIEAALRSFQRHLNDEFDPRTDETTRWIARELRSIVRALGSHYPHVVVLADSLDRMSDLDRFSSIVQGAVAPLRSQGIGVVLVGPLTALYGIERVVLDRFDRVWHLPAVDVQNESEGHEFLRSVLRARDTNGLLTEGAAERLASLSGGVLRDLMTLTQVAGEEAYVDGAERVDVSYVETAADLFGRKHLVGVDSEQLALLQQVRTKGTFIQTSEKHLALLSTRRVLEYMNGKPRFAVHPTIEPLLAQIAGAS